MGMGIIRLIAQDAVLDMVPPPLDVDPLVINQRNVVFALRDIGDGINQDARDPFWQYGFLGWRSPYAGVSRGSLLGALVLTGVLSALCMRVFLKK